MKRARGPRAAIISVLLLGLLVFGGVYFAWNTASDIFQPVSPPGAGKVIPITIRSGETTAQIADDLQAKGLIRNALAFRIWAKIKGLDTQLQAGVYTKLSTSMTISEIVDQLLNGQPDAYAVLIQEGWRLEQIAKQFGAAGLVKFKADEFLKYTKHPDQFPDADKYPILKSIPAGSGMEGLLFPDTYNVPVDYTARDVVNLMLQEFNDKVKQNNLDKLAQQNKLTLYQAVILASIVEREAIFDADRGGIASVYWNRIKRPNDETVGLLDADPTVQYARDSQSPPKKYWAPLADAAINTVPGSAWNTYTHKGWPPTPICSPGLKSLLAAAAPAKTDDYFFLNIPAGKPNAGHAVFAKTKAEFDQDVKKYLQS